LLELLKSEQTLLNLRGKCGDFVTHLLSIRLHNDKFRY
jgi:hypothetical protein